MRSHPKAAESCRGTGFVCRREDEGDTREAGGLCLKLGIWPKGRYHEGTRFILV